jgi:hypothetical protein
MDQIGPVDLFIGIMWKHFGSPTGVAGSGTEEEFDQALESCQRTGRPRMLCYFSLAPIEPPGTVKEAKQLLKVAQFRERVEKEALVGTYRSDAEFKERLREHLQWILRKEFAGRRPPLDRNLQALLDVEKERCRDRDVAFFTPNLLLPLLAARSSARRIFDLACPRKAEEILERLRRYEPVDAAGTHIPFSDFDWYDRDDVQAARRRARQEGAPEIDARHLLFGLLDTESGTRTELRQTLGAAQFESLHRLALSGIPTAAETPGIGDFFKRPAPPRNDT